MKILTKILVSILLAGSIVTSAQSEKIAPAQRFEVDLSAGISTNIASSYANSEWYELNEYYFSEFQLGLDTYLGPNMAIGVNVGYLRIFESRYENASTAVSFKAQFEDNKFRPFCEVDLGIIWSPYGKTWLTARSSRLRFSPGMHFNTAGLNRFFIALNYDHYIDLIWEERNDYFEGLVGIRAGVLL